MAEPFNETTDGVKAKLEVEIPEQALTTLSQLAKQTEAYRVSMEAAARATGNHQEYLEKMPTIADVATKKLKEWCDQVEHAIELKGKMGGLEIPGATGQDSANPFGNSTMGRGDLANLLNPMANNDPNRIVSMGAARGMVAPGAVGGMSDEQIDKLARALTSAVTGEDDNDGSGAASKRPKHADPKKAEEDQGLSPRALEQGALKGRDLIGKMMGEVGPGASLGDAVGAGRDLLGMAEGAGGMLGKAAGFLGPVGAAAGLALTANQLIQMGGQRLQDYKNLGSESGGGISEGMGYDAQAKMLALDPFISTAQAREVIQGALSAGHSGASFDKVTEFIASNLKEMNMSVNDSVSLLKTNVEEGGESISQLGSQLANLKGMAANGSQSLSELKSDFGANTSALSAMGVQNQGQIAEQFMGAFSNSPLLASVGTSVIQSALNSPAFIGAIASGSGIKGGSPEVVLRKLSKSGQLPDQVWKTLAKQAEIAKRGSNDPDVQVDMFHKRLQTMGLQISFNEAAGLFEQLNQPGGAAAATQRGNDALMESSKPVDQSFGEQSMSGAVQLGNHVKNWLGTAGNELWDIATLNWGALSGDDQAGVDREGQIDREHEADSAKYTTEALKQAVKQYGQSNLTVVDPSTGKSSPLDNLNKDQRDQLAAQKLQLSAYGGAPQTLANFGASQAAGPQQVNVSATPLTVSYQGPISGPTSVKLTTNQQQANTGYPGATVNKPPPGDK